MIRIKLGGRNVSAMGAEPLTPLAEIHYPVLKADQIHRAAMTNQDPDCELLELNPERYARWRASEVGAITERLERRLIFDLVDDVRGRSVLDVRCGDGDLAVELSKHGAHVVGIDASEFMISAAKQRAERDQVDVEFRVATAQHLPCSPEQFDIVVAVTILCFVDDAAKRSSVYSTFEEAT